MMSETAVLKQRTLAFPQCLALGCLLFSPFTAVTAAAIHTNKHFCADSDMAKRKHVCSMACSPRADEQLPIGTVIERTKLPEHVILALLFCVHFAFTGPASKVVTD